MGAIDLLFDVKRDSERLHQLVLGALLSRTALVERLVPLSQGMPRAGQRPDRGQDSSLHTLILDPLGKAFDLGIVGPGFRVLVEVKLDTPIAEDHLAQRISRMQDGDRLLCLLLGYSALSTDRISLRDRIARIGQLNGRPDLVDRVSLRDAGDLIPLLSDPTLLSPESQDKNPLQRDARDLAMAYRDALWLLQERLRAFIGRSPSDWGEGDLYGFYAACRELRSGSPLRIGRLASADGNPLGCRLLSLPVRGGQAVVELAFEGTRLCLRLLPQPGASEPRRALREAAQDALRKILSTPAQSDLPWVEAAPRLTAVMSLATSESPLTGPLQPTDVQPGGRVAQALATAEDTLRKLAAQLIT